MIDPKRLHMQFYELASEHGPVMTLMILNEPVMVLNSIEASLEAKLRRGTYKRANEMKGFIGSN